MPSSASSSVSSPQGIAPLPALPGEGECQQGSSGCPFPHARLLLIPTPTHLSYPTLPTPCGLPLPAEYNFDNPEAFDSAAILDCLLALKQGHPYDVPIYDFTTHSRRCVLRACAWVGGWVGEGWGLQRASGPRAPAIALAVPPRHQPPQPPALCFCFSFHKPLLLNSSTPPLLRSSAPPAAPRRGA